jgi:dTDP-glucose pyrophosphorylase
MKTPMQELIDQLKSSKKDEYGLAFAIDMLLENEQAMLEKEKEAMVDFAYKFGDEPLSEIPKWYDKQFNTK